MTIKVKMLSMMIGLMVVPFAHAKMMEHTPLVPAQSVIENLKTTIDEIHNASSIKVVFPTNVPKPTVDKLYALNESNHPNANLNKQWIITITSDPDCKIKSCQVGAMSASLDEPIDKEYLQPPFPNPKKKAKEKVILLNHTVAYFTPSHAEADWHPAQMEWQVNNVLYCLTWDLKNSEKTILTAMANSSLKK